MLLILLTMATLPLCTSCQQVLVSIQGLILIKDPMFNEPSYEKIQGTKEGDVSLCSSYTITLVTMVGINFCRQRVLNIMLTFIYTL